MALVLKRLLLRKVVEARDWSILLSRLVSKKPTISSVDILRFALSWRVLRRKSEEALEMWVGMSVLMEIALICLLRSAYVLAFQGVCPVSIS